MVNQFRGKPQVNPRRQGIVERQHLECTLIPGVAALVRISCPLATMAPVLGSKSTALEALRGADLTGKTAVVTGGHNSKVSDTKGLAMCLKNAVSAHRCQLGVRRRNGPSTGSCRGESDHNKSKLDRWSEGR